MEVFRGSEKEFQFTRVSSQSTKALSRIDSEKNCLRDLEESKVPTLKQCKSMNSIAFSAYCENSLKRVSSYEKLLNTEKIKIRLMKFEKDNVEIDESLLSRDINTFPKVKNLRQLKRKTTIMRYKQTLLDMEKIQS